MSTSLLRHQSSTSLLAHLVESPELVRQVRALPAPVFSKLIRHVGLEDAGELVALATTQQLVTAFDEDLFKNDRPGEHESFDPQRFVTWLEVLLEAGEATAAARVAELSEDFVANALNGLVLVVEQDHLREAMDDDGGPAALRVDKQLESALTEELDGYLLIARVPDGWDAIFALLLALDRDHRAFLERVLDRCAAASIPLTEDLELMGETLSEGASLAEDVEAERDERRARSGHVEPRDARAFLALAKKASDTRDPITKSSLRAFEAEPVPELEAARLSSLIEQWTGEEEPKPRRRALPGPDRAIVEALQSLRARDEGTFEARMAELAYLANVLVAGAEVEGRRLRPSEASEAALATVELGARLRVHRASVAQLTDVLATRSADLLFRDGFSAHGTFLLGRGDVEHALAHLRSR